MQFYGGAVWKKIRSVARGARHRTLVVGFATNANGIVLRRGDILIVDASDGRIASGATTSDFVATAWRTGVEVYSCKDLHAKVFLLGDTVVVGSANLSIKSQSLTEAVVISADKDLHASASEWIRSLQTRSIRVDEEFITRICAIPVAPRTWTGSSKKISLLEIVRSQNTDLANDLSFRVWSDEASVSTRTVKDAAHEAGIPKLPTGWTFFEDPFSRAYEQHLRTLRTRFLISFTGRGDEPKGLRGFKGLDKEPGSYIGWVRIGGSMISIFDSDKPAPCRLAGPEAAQLCQLMNAGARANPRLLQQINDAPGWAFEFPTLAEMVNVGLDVNSGRRA